MGKRISAKDVSKDLYVQVYFRNMKKCVATSRHKRLKWWTKKSSTTFYNLFRRHVWCWCGAKQLCAWLSIWMIWNQDPSKTAGYVFLYFLVFPCSSLSSSLSTYSKSPYTRNRVGSVLAQMVNLSGICRRSLFPSLAVVHFWSGFKLLTKIWRCKSI